jgi:hypothetical protein
VVRSYNVLKNIKSAFKHQDRISLNVFVDAEAAKALSEQFCLLRETGNLNGYVQIFNQNPFGLLLMSHIQLC